MLFILRQIITRLAMPLPLTVLLLIAALVLILRFKRPKTGAALSGAALGIICLSSLSFTAEILIRPLENTYPPLNEFDEFDDTNDLNETDKIDKYEYIDQFNKPVIVVLGAGHYIDSSVSPLARLTEAGLARMAEGVRLFFLYTQEPANRSKAYSLKFPVQPPYCAQTVSPVLVFTGGAIWGETSIAQAMAEGARALGVPGTSIITIPEGRTTHEEAQLIAELLKNMQHPYGDDLEAMEEDKKNKDLVPGEGRKTPQGPESEGEPVQLILVTSASHMPRSMLLFNKFGMQPQAAPTHYHSLSRSGISPNYFFPNAGALRTTERAIHEYLGLLYTMVRF